jgi:hypothetical protein
MTKMLTAILIEHAEEERKTSFRPNLDWQGARRLFRPAFLPRAFPIAAARPMR